MKIRHRIPTLPQRSAVVSDEYQAEVDRSTRRLEKQYQQAEKRLRAAEERASRAAQLAGNAAAGRSKVVAQWQAAEALVELRRQELVRLASLMQASPQSAANRGRKSFRPVPTPGSGP